MIAHDDLLAALPDVFTGVALSGFGPKTTGKVRDIYRQNDRLTLITTDRVSAFDRVLGHIPYKGQVLNQLSLWWFEQLRDIVPHHVVHSPDPNVVIAREAESIPVEVVVRGYITGVTSTSMWTLYEQGDRQPYGISLPDGLRKNDPLPGPVITPTTKARDGGHDQRLTRQELLDRGIVAPDLWQQIESVAVAIFQRGQALAEKAGLILVDTKYEFGLIDGQLTLIDEVHTPDSSRYWLHETYRPDQTPEHYDKEFMRLWYARNGYRGEGNPPTMPAEFVAQIAQRYIETYERLTASQFQPGATPTDKRIQQKLSAL